MFQIHDDKLIPFKALSPEERQIRLEERAKQREAFINSLDKEYENNLNPEVFRKRLEIAIKYSSKNRKQIEDECDVTSSMLTNYINSTPIPSRKTFRGLCESLGVSKEWLMGAYEDADIDFGYKRRLKANQYSNRPARILIRGNHLAYMLSVHAHQPLENQPLIEDIVDSICRLDKVGLQKVSEFSKLMASNNHLREELVNYTASEADLDAVDPGRNAYADLIELNKISMQFSTNFRQTLEPPRLSDENVELFLKILEANKDDPSLNMSFDIFLNKIMEMYYIPPSLPSSFEYIDSIRNRSFEGNRGFTFIYDYSNSKKINKEFGKEDSNDFVKKFDIYTKKYQNMANRIKQAPSKKENKND